MEESNDLDATIYLTNLPPMFQLCKELHQLRKAVHLYDYDCLFFA